MGKTATIIYRLSQAGQKASILAGGDGKNRQEVVVTSVTPELLALASVGPNGQIVLDLTGHKANNMIVEYDGRLLEDARSSSPFWQYFDAPQTAEQLIAWETGRIQHLRQVRESLQDEAQAKKAEYAERMAERAAAEESRKKFAAEREAREEAAKQAALRERAEWISQYGSAHLRRGTALGYNCQRMYVTERAALEVPSFDVDFDNRAEWQDRACPSMAAIEQVEDLTKHGATVVWLTHPAHALGDWEDQAEWERREAVVIECYLGKYTLVKEI